MSFETDLLRQALARIRDATDASGGAKLPPMMRSNAKAWERRGFIELHHGAEPGTVLARITAKGRAVAAGRLKRGT